MENINALPKDYLISRRYYTTVMAMQGLLSSRESYLSINKDAMNNKMNPTLLSKEEYLASQCYIIADAMLEMETI